MFARRVRVLSWYGCRLVLSIPIGMFVAGIATETRPARDFDRRGRVPVLRFRDTVPGRPSPTSAGLGQSLLVR